MNPDKPCDRPSSEPLNTPAAGAPMGDFGETDGEMLVDGEEEVFSRSEVESGRIEHQAESGSQNAGQGAGGGGWGTRTRT